MRTIGHEATWNQLDRAFRGDRLAHALLFTGPPGIGKALLARDFAARVLCQGDSPPCGECDRCRQVEAQTHPDLRLVTVPAGKREIGVEVARDVKRFMQMHGIGGVAKIVIVVEADRLSIAAQNALLKTLEEPPGRAILMLVTDSPGALLSTVRSRCQRIAFRPLDDDHVRSVLRHHKLEDREIEELLPLAQGSPGRALELRELLAGSDLEQLRTALAGLGHGRYGPVVEFAQALGRTEQEMTSRLALLEEVLQQRLTATVRAGAAEAAAVDGKLRALAVLSDARILLRRRNPNRPLLAEAVALRLARIPNDDARND
jgi:DNA polymerase III subunit delta'